MNEIIMLTKDDFKSLINEISHKAGKVSAIEVLSQIEKKQEDKISKDEALSLLGVGTDKLAKMRENREIIYYAASRPFRYSRRSVEEYLDGLTITTAKLIKYSA